MSSANYGASAPPRVYSYIRYSTPDQRFGDSERRQLQAAREFAERNKMPLDEGLKLIDSGRSGYKGHNRTKGALGEFLRAVQAGDIPSGSILLVENIDRLSREDFLTAIDTVSQIVRSGITIVTLMPFAEYTNETIKGGLIWQLVGQIQAAYEQSAAKSRRIRASREQAREMARNAGKPLTQNCPAWLKLKPDRSAFEVIPDAAETVRQIYQMRLAGLGVRAIERRLNADAAWAPVPRPQSHSGGWRASYIKKILRNPAVVGEYQPFQSLEGGRIPIGEPIPGYFPPIVDTELFHAVQHLMAANRGMGGRTGKALNLFVHVAKCAYCGGPMAYEDKGRPPKGSRYLVCDNGRRGVRCSRYRIRYDECEDLLLRNCPRLKPELVLPPPDDKAAKLKELRRRVQGNVGRIAAIEQQFENLIDQIARTQSPMVRDRLGARLEELSKDKDHVQSQVLRDEKSLAKLEQNSRNFSRWKKTLEELRVALTQDDVDLRLRLRLHLRELVAKVEIFSVGYLQRYDCYSGREGDDLAETADSLFWEVNPDLTRTRLFHEFLENLSERRMSREGRFIRVWFTTGAVIDLVPPRSLAEGMKLLRNGVGEWQFVRPDLDTLWREFMQKQAKTAICECVKGNLNGSRTRAC